MSRMNMYKNERNKILKKSNVEKWKDRVIETRRLSRQTILFKNRNLGDLDCLFEDENEHLETPLSQRQLRSSPMKKVKSADEKKRERLAAWKAEKAKRKALEVKRPTFKLGTKVLNDPPIFLHSEFEFTWYKDSGTAKGPPASKKGFSLKQRCPTGPPTEKRDFNKNLMKPKATTFLKKTVLGPSNIVLGPSNIGGSSRPMTRSQTRTGVPPPTVKKPPILNTKKTGSFNRKICHGKENLLHSPVEGPPVNIRESQILRGDDLICFDSPKK